MLLLLLTTAGGSAARQRDTLSVGARTGFIQNLGQWKAPFLFKAELGQATLFAETGGLTFVIKGKGSAAEESLPPYHHQHSTLAHAYKVRFVGSSPQVAVAGQEIDPSEGYDNYYLSNDPKDWKSRVPHHKTLLYQGLYPGIDMDVRVAQHALKTNFYLSAGTDPATISMEYEGVEKLYLASGNLIIRTSVGEIVEASPYAYQQCDTGRCEVAVRYRLAGNRLSFVVGEYDTTRPLVIDPVLHFSTYTGSTADNWGTTATYDYEKNTYTAGLVFGVGYPTSTGAYDLTFGGRCDIGIFKFDSTGAQRLFATYLGGADADMPHSMFTNSFNELVIFGTTGSQDFPTTAGAFQRTLKGGSYLQYEGPSSSIIYPNGSDIFVSRFSSDGTQLQASTYVGGYSNDGLNYRNSFNSNSLTYMCGNDSLYFNYGDGARGEIITDDLNNVYVGSTTFSMDFPATTGSVDAHPMAGQNGVVFKLDYNLRNMIWCTYLGGNGDDAVYSIDVDSSYNVIACGGTNSADFPTTPGAYQTSYSGGTADGFVSKISYHGDRLIASTYFGSEAYDQVYFVRTGKHDEVFLFGQTKATGSSMIYNAGYSTPGAGNLLARLLPDLSGRVWSTVFGTNTGRPNLSPTAFAADVCNRVYAVGWGRDYVGACVSDFAHGGCHNMEVTTDAYQSSTDGQDFYIMAIDAAASHLDYATFFGEDHEQARYGGRDHVDGGTSRLDRRSTLYQSVCASCGGNNSFPTTADVWSEDNSSSNCNNAVFRFTVHTDYPVAEFMPPPVGCAPYTVTFRNVGRGTQYRWQFGDGDSSTLASPTHTFDSAGTYRVRLIAMMENGCKAADTTYASIAVLSPNEGKRYTLSACEGEFVQIGHKPMLGCTYHWLSEGVSDSTVANPLVNRAGCYIVRMTTYDGTCNQTDTFEVRYAQSFDTLIITNPTCPGHADGSALVRLPAAANESVQILWDGVLGDTLLTGLGADGRQHLLTVVNGGCTSTVAFTLTDPASMEHSIEAGNILCSDDCNGWIRLSYGYPGGATTDSLVENLCAGTYVLLFADTAGCPYSDSATIIRDTLLQHMEIWADDYEILLGQSVGLHVSPSPGATYSWSYPSTLSNPHSPNPIATPEDTLTTYQCTVVDSMGCAWFGEVAIHCTEISCGRSNIFIPNAFSPNDDGINDRLTFRGHWVLDFQLSIYSRWGEKVFETHDINDSWDGRYKGSWCQPGVYTYYCRVKCEAGLESLLKGDITLIR